jgi:hypothetical protein
MLFLLCISDQQKNMHFLEDHPMNIPTQIDSNWPNELRED